MWGQKKTKQKALDRMNSSWSFMWSVTLIYIPGEWKAVERVIKYIESGKLLLFNHTVQTGCEYLPSFYICAGLTCCRTEAPCRPWSSWRWSALFSSRGGSDVAQADDRRRGRAADDFQYFSTEADNFSFFAFSTLIHQSLHFLWIPLRLHVRTVHTWGYHSDTVTWEEADVSVTRGTRSTAMER